MHCKNSASVAAGAVPVHRSVCNIHISLFFAVQPAAVVGHIPADYSSAYIQTAASGMDSAPGTAVVVADNRINDGQATTGKKPAACIQRAVVAYVGVRNRRAACNKNTATPARCRVAADNSVLDCQVACQTDPAAIIGGCLVFTDNRVAHQQICINSHQGTVTAGDGQS